MDSFLTPLSGLFLGPAGLLHDHVRKAFKHLYHIGIGGRNVCVCDVRWGGDSNYCTIFDTNTNGFSRPRWLSWMRRPTGYQEVAGSTSAEVGNILSWRLIMKYFLRSFSPFR